MSGNVMPPSAWWLHLNLDSCCRMPKWIVTSQGMCIATVLGGEGCQGPSLKRTLILARESSWQPPNGNRRTVTAKKCDHGRSKKVRNKQPKKCENERKSAKWSKTSENWRKRAKTIGMCSFCSFWGHFPVAI